MKTHTRLAILSAPILLLSCHKDLGVDPVQQELQRYTILFARNTTLVGASTRRAIYLASADGSNLQDLSQNPGGWDSGPRFSPNGTLIAFLSNRQGNQDLYVMNADGTNKSNITNSNELDLEHNWSPDGTKLAFTRVQLDTYVLNVIGANGAGLTPVTSTAEDYRYPAWSPNGLEMACARFNATTKRRQIMVMNADGSNVRALSDTTDNSGFPQWSKDGSRIYYFVAGFGVKVKSVDGLFGNSLAGFYPRSLSWSPDGQWFVEADSVSIVKIAADLSSFTRVGVTGFEPEVSPDGSWLLYLKRNDSAVAELYVARTDGRDERRVTTSQYGDLDPSWKP
jgi:Tol biopolymer transport system component